MNLILPFNLREWIESHRELLKPPVCNRELYAGSEFIVMIVGGPNSRKDYHVDAGPELFYQVEDDDLGGLRFSVGYSFSDLPDPLMSDLHAGRFVIAPFILLIDFARDNQRGELKVPGADEAASAHRNADVAPVRTVDRHMRRAGAGSEIAAFREQTLTFLIEISRRHGRQAGQGDRVDIRWKRFLCRGNGWKGREQEY